MGRVISEGEFQFKCERCNHEMSGNGADLDWNCVDTHARQMGVERMFEATWMVNCDNCGNLINISFVVYEYPDGTHNHDEHQIDGGTVLRECSYSIDF